MIVSGDKRASSAFLEGLRAEPVSNVTPLNGRSILQVSGLDQAIAIADDGLRVRARMKSEPPPDIFDSLVSATDDVAAAAIYRPYIPTPLPPRADETLLIAIPPPAALPSFPAPVLVLDRDLFYRPPPPAAETEALEARASIRRFAWAAAAFIVPVATLIAIMAIFASTETDPPRAAPSTMVMPAPAVPAPTSPTTASPQLVHPADEIMVVEVNRLKTAPPKKPRRAH